MFIYDDIENKLADYAKTMDAPANIPDPEAIQIAYYLNDGVVEDTVALCQRWMNCYYNPSIQGLMAELYFKGVRDRNSILDRLRNLESYIMERDNFEDSEDEQ